MQSDLRYRQIHLDFHTSEHIDGIAADFDPEHFAKTLKEAHVDSVTVFARGHHGWAYYPSQVAPQHPHLERDLLGDMIAACRANDINVPAYITVQLDEHMAREHPEWRALNANGDGDQFNARWHPICLAHEEYVDYLIAQSEEIIERYKPDGLFYDILAVRPCACRACVDRMHAAGMDPTKHEDRMANGRQVLFDYYERVTAAVRAKDPDMRVFHNSGHIFKGERDRWEFFSHLELESLPTGGWGYDHFPVSARYTATLGMEFLGMTGKFHTTWGEFGGFKRPVALEYECMLMVANGARCSIGDQLHPRGALDADTYKSIAPAYARVKQLEPYLRDASAVCQIAMLSAEATAAGASSHRGNDESEIDAGLARMLLEEQLQFDVLDAEADFTAYELLILPDKVIVDEALAKKLQAYRQQGGRLLLTGASGMDVEASRFMLDLDVDYAGVCSETEPDFVVVRDGLDPDLVRSPFVVYGPARAVKARRDEQVLAESRAPYFNRTYKHFCSHQHAPARPERNAAYDAMIQVDDATIYLAHGICHAYYRSGQPQFKYLLRSAIDRLLQSRMFTSSLPTSARVSVNRQAAEQRHVVHILYAQPQLRGSAHPIWGQPRQLEIIEDVVPLVDQSISLALDAAPAAVTDAYTGAAVPHRFENGRLLVDLPRIDLHACLVIADA